MKIKIREWRGQYATTGFYPKGGVRLRPNEVFEYDPGEEELYEQAIATGFVEAAGDEKPRRGRPPKNA